MANFDLRFVVLEHDHPELHWDLMFEHEGVLKTWRLAEYPPRLGQEIAATALNDHRLLYLEYEGPVSGDRGSVRCVDRGRYDIFKGDWTCDRICLDLSGKELNDFFLLERIEGDAWRFLLMEP